MSVPPLQPLVDKPGNEALILGKKYSGAFETQTEGGRERLSFLFEQKALNITNYVLSFSDTSSGLLVISEFTMKKGKVRYKLLENNQPLDFQQLADIICQFVGLFTIHLNGAHAIAVNGKKHCPYDVPINAYQGMIAISTQFGKHFMSKNGPIIQGTIHTSAA